MKKFLAVIMAVVVLAACLASCGKKYKWMNYDYSKYITLADYTNIEVDRSSDEYLKLVNNYIHNTLDTAGLSEDTEIKDGVVESGDTTVIDFVGRIDGKTFEGGSSDDYSLEIGSGSFIPGFEDGLIGAKVGEKRVLKLTFPENYNPDYAGKDVEFTVTVDKITRKTYPEVTEEIAKSLGFENLSAFQKDAFSNALTNYTMNYMVENSDVISYPEDAVDTMVQVMVDNYTNYCTAQGTTFETFLSYYSMTEEDFRKDLSEDASMLEALKSYLICYAICEKEDLYPSGDEYKKKADAILTSSESALNSLSDQTKDSMVEANIVTQVVSEFLVNTIKDITVTDTSSK